MPWRRNPEHAWRPPREQQIAHEPEKLDPSSSLPEVLLALDVARFTGKVTVIFRGGKPTLVVRRGKGTVIK